MIQSFVLFFFFFKPSEMFAVISARRSLSNFCALCFQLAFFFLTHSNTLGKTKFFKNHSLCAFKQKKSRKAKNSGHSLQLNGKFQICDLKFLEFFVIMLYFNSPYPLLYSDGNTTAFYGAFGKLYYLLLLLSSWMWTIFGKKNLLQLFSSTYCSS